MGRITAVRRHRGTITFTQVTMPFCRAQKIVRTTVYVKPRLIKDGVTGERQCPDCRMLKRV